MKKSIEYNIEWAKQQVIPEFIFFWKHYNNKKFLTKSCLSQFFPCKFKSNDIEYNCAEQYMMSEKAKLFKDEEIYQLILKETSPDKIKRLGRQIKNFNNREWDKNKLNIILQGNILKFSQNEDLKKFLIETGDKILVEASPYDKIWGIGLDQKNPDARNPHKWNGLNLLGFTLMKVRDIIKKNEEK